MLTPAKLADIIAEQEAVFIKRQPKSAALADRAAGVLAGGPALNALGSIMLAMSLIIVVIGYVGYRLLTRGERGSGLSALAAISGEA